MLDNPRIRAFATFVRDHGVNALLDCLERNEQAGIRYHYPGKIVGDYDAPGTRDGIYEMIEHGNPRHE